MPYFRTLLTKLVVDCNDYEVAVKQIKRERKFKSKDSSKDEDVGPLPPPGNKKKQKKRNRKDRADDKDKGDDDDDNDGTSPPPSKKEKNEWTEKCLNPACGGIHRLKDCNKTSEALKKELFKKLRNKNKMARLIHSDLPEIQGSPDAEEGRFKDLIEDRVHTIALGDYGADFSALT